jgi:hypothetical protein
MKKLIETWPYEFWPLEALGGVVMVAMIGYAIMMILRSIDQGIQRVGYEQIKQSNGMRFGSKICRPRIAARFPRFFLQ